MVKIIFSIIIGIIAIVCFVISWFQFKEKGFLFNNAYIYASEQERKTMNKKPYYRQSAIVFFACGLMFLIVDAGIIFKADWLACVAVALAIAMIVYAIVSYFRIKKRK